MSTPVASEQELLAASRALASGSTDPVELQRLGRSIGKAISRGQFTDRKIKIAMLSSFLTDMLRDALAGCLLGRGIAAEMVSAPYGVIATDLFSTHSVTRDADLVVILPTYRDLVRRPSLGCTRKEADDASVLEAQYWRQLWQRIGSKPIVQMSFGPAPVHPLSNADGFSPGGLLRFMRDVNRRLADEAPNNVALLDAETLAARVGPGWNDLSTYFVCKQPFGIGALAEMANSVAATITGLLGKARKVLVLDLDNTLWGGVVGDVGLQGIVVGPESAEGEAFVAIQEHVRDLASRGIILAVCSKNNEQIAREPFRSHSGMVLRESDIACFVANFEDKATNLRRIAQTLNVGLDSLVFVDDNPVERAWVARELPEVAVVDLPPDSALYVDAIERAQLFPLHRITAEDLGRNQSYHSRAVVAQAQAQAAGGDVSQFLQSLDPVVIREEVGPGSLERIVQLIAKTNQFKLNPRTFTADEIVAFGEGVFAIRFRDRLQDYGIVAVAVTSIEAGELRILNWVMSCRVFSRELEHATLKLMETYARSKKVRTFRAPFTPSAKNSVARDMLTALGFAFDDAGDLVLDQTPKEYPP